MLDPMGREGNSTTMASPVTPTVENATKSKKNRPLDTKLRQQKLSAWQPILTASTVIPIVFGIAVIFIPIGVVLLLASEGVGEFETDYTDCPNASCSYNISLEKDFKGDVYFYYGLYNYYQNHRRYMKSRSDSQLLGNIFDVNDCEPYARLNTSSGEKVIAPCGAVANSMFNDSFELFLKANGTKTKVPWTFKGVVWPVDRERKFRNPSGDSLKEAFEGTVKPPNWGKKIFELDPENPENNGFQNTDFIVWMRTAALPNFRKLYRILVRNGSTFENGLVAGVYQLEIHSVYPVKVFGGRKSFIISTTSWIGGKNAFLGITYIVVGCICVIVGLALLFIHFRFGKSLNEMANVSDQPR